MRINISITKLPIVFGIIIGTIMNSIGDISIIIGGREKYS